jgi:integrase
MWRRTQVVRERSAKPLLSRGKSLPQSSKTERTRNTTCILFGTDFRLLLSVIEEKDFRELCITGLLTGLRLSELINLHWSDFDFASKLILIRNTETFTTKDTKERIVPMSDELYRLLKDRKEAIRFECEVVFHNKNGGELLYTSVSQKFKKYVRRAGLNDKLHFHSLRHSFASALVSSGVSLYVN